MNCEEASLLIEEFHDGEVDSLAKSRFEEHVAVCPACSVRVERMMSLDRLLEKSSTPPPASAQLEQTLVEAFRRRHRKAAASPAWWRRIFVGSVSIPKPAFAAALLAVALTVLVVGIGKNDRGVSSESSTAALPATTPTASEPLPPEVIEKTKIVEVPVVRERVVTRVVYVERESRGAVTQNRVSRNRQRRAAKEGDADLASSGEDEDGEYVTRANLSGFQPIAELKTRIIPNK